MSPSPHRSLLICLAAAVSLVTGCTNLGAIQEFGKISSDSAGYTRLTDEYLSAPKRQKAYLLNGEKERAAELDRSSAERGETAGRLAIYHKAVEGYMRSLADLAGDQVVSYDKELGSLADAASSAALLPHDELDAVKSISSLIARAATDYYRQRQLRDVIAAANAPLQIVMADMVTIVDGYGGSIDSERSAFTEYYRYLLATAGEERPRGSGPREPAAAQAIRDTFEERMPAFSDRAKAAAAYAESLRTIAQAHQSLFDNRDRLSDASVESMVKDYSVRIYKTYKVVRK